jgi:hypothetical protein
MKEKKATKNTLQESQGEGARSETCLAKGVCKKPVDLSSYKRGQVFHISHFISHILQTCI